MQAQDFLAALDCEFFTGVPDSLLKPLCDLLQDRYGSDPKHHLICANEGNAVAVAAGHILAGGAKAAVYLQNSGEGNVVNPFCSLLQQQVYGIGLTFIIGWRGEPGVHDEPQHIFQGQVTLGLLDTLQIPYLVVSTDTTPDEVHDFLQRYGADQETCKALVIRKGALSYKCDRKPRNDYSLNREQVIDLIAQAAADDFIVSTTGKISRELYEISCGLSPLTTGQEKARISASHDFLTVGSMGHCSSIALGLALQRPEQRFWCLDGDGSLLMHLGAAAVIGALKPKNLVHIVLNNAAHDSVGGMPTVAAELDLKQIMSGCGYCFVRSVSTLEQLQEAITQVKQLHELSFIEVKCALGSRDDLGRPKSSAADNKHAFMHALSQAK